MLKAKYKAVKVMSMQKVPCDALCKKLEKIKCKKPLYIDGLVEVLYNL
jgi:hypothetical protein